jgi:hypothetical protein
MQTVDPDLLYALKSFDLLKNNIIEKVRNNRLSKKREEQLLDRMTTHIELLTDELTQIVPKDHPLFLPLLTLAMIRKMQVGPQAEPEFVPDFEKGFPPGW